MPNDSVPWAIGGGARMQAESLRALAYAATGGGQGVGSRSDCKVLPLAVPGNKVRVSPGTVTIRNNFPGVNRGQSYLAQFLSDAEVNVTATGGSPRSDLVVARISDPQYDGTTPPSVQDGPYRFASIIPNVPNTTKTTDGLGLTYPAEALARIDIPASTATITAGMIVDVRRLAMARSERFLTDYGLGDIPQFLPTWTTPHYWPSNAINLSIPPWATKMIATYTLAGIAVSQNMYGQSRFMLQDGATYYPAPIRVWDFNGSVFIGGDLFNENIVMVGTLDVSPIAGKTVLLYVESMSYGSFPPAGYLFARPDSRAIFDAQFQETIEGSAAPLGSPAPEGDIDGGAP